MASCSRTASSVSCPELERGWSMHTTLCGTGDTIVADPACHAKEARAAWDLLMIEGCLHKCCKDKL